MVTPPTGDRRTVTSRDWSARLNRLVLVAAVVLAVLGAALPALAGRLAPSGGTLGIPSYWARASAYLDAHSAGGTTLVVPGSAFATYLWGDPRDEPLQSLAHSPWAVRNAIPLAPPGNIRMLDRIETELAGGAGSAALTDYLRRAGVTHLLVRNDLVTSDDITNTLLVHQTLAGTPGIERTATFGPTVGGGAHLHTKRGRVLVDGGWQSTYPAVEIFRVREASRSPVTTDQLPVVVGGPEDLLDLDDLGLLNGDPTELASDLTGPPEPGAPLILTDGLRRVERNFGRLHDGTSATLATTDPWRLAPPTHDYLLSDNSRWVTRATLTGVRQVSASSSMSDAKASGERSRVRPFVRRRSTAGRGRRGSRTRPRRDAPGGASTSFTRGTSTR